MRACQGYTPGKKHLELILYNLPTSTLQHLFKGTAKTVDCHLFLKQNITETISRKQVKFGEDMFPIILYLLHIFPAGCFTPFKGP